MKKNKEPRTDGRYQVHVYFPGNAQTHYYNDLTEAKTFARECFKIADCYKVKIWDRDKGPIEPNRPKAKGLVFELV